MFLHERQNTIIQLLQESGKVLVKDLSERFGVTEDCIRKDLAALEKQGLLKRAYGGAITERVNVHRENVCQRLDRNPEGKRIIARKMFNLIQDGEMVFLDISTSNIELARMLAESRRDVTVVTNMIEVLNVLVHARKENLIFIGGTFSRIHDGFVGSFANEMIAKLRCDRAFLGTVGVNLHDNSAFSYIIEDCYTKKTVMSISRHSYLLAENEKFTTDGNIKFANIDDFRGIITEENPGEEILKKLDEYQIEVI